MLQTVDDIIEMTTKSGGYVSSSSVYEDTMTPTPRKEDILYRKDSLAITPLCQRYRDCR
jgi:hypothetical protein